MPKMLRKNVETLTIHKGVHAAGGNGEDILIHTG